MQCTMMVEVCKESIRRWKKEIDLLEVKRKYSLHCSIDEDLSEASISIAYERLKSSFEEDSESSVNTLRFKDILGAKHTYNIYDEEFSELSATASISYQRKRSNTPEHSSISSHGRRKRVGRPYKVCSSRYTERKGVVATSFQELLDKGKNLCFMI